MTKVNQVQTTFSGLCANKHCEGTRKVNRCRGSILFTASLLVECTCTCHALSAYMRHVAGMPTVLLWGIPMYIEADHYSATALNPVPVPPAWGEPVVINLDAVPSMDEAWTPLAVLADSRRPKTSGKDLPVRMMPREIVALCGKYINTGLDQSPVDLLKNSRRPTREASIRSDAPETKSDIRDMAMAILTPDMVSMYTSSPFGGVTLSELKKFFIGRFGYDVSSGALENQLKRLADAGRIRLETSPLRVVS